MPKLNEHMKRILSDLAMRDVDQALPKECNRGPGIEPEIGVKLSSPSLEPVRKPSSHRIALLSDGRGTGAPIDYVIEACVQQDAMIDLLIHDKVDMAGISVLENQIRAAGIDFRHVQLGTNPIDDIIGYVSDHTSLIYLVAIPDDDIAKTLMQEMKPKHGSRIPVPLVLIEDKSTTRHHKRSAV